MKEHIWSSHRSRIELMPGSFLSENNGFWMANFPDSYARVIQPSNENSVEAIKARIEVLEFISRVQKTTRTKEQWIAGWKCPKKLVVEEEDDQEASVASQKRPYSPSRPNLFEDMELQLLTVGLGNTYAIFRLDLDVTVRDYKIEIDDEALKDSKTLDNLVRRMTALIGIRYNGSMTFEITLDKEQKETISKVASRKLSIKETLITAIKTNEELFPAKKAKMTVPIPLSPLKTPSTSEIVLDEEEEINDNGNDKSGKEDRQSQGKHAKHQRSDKDSSIKKSKKESAKKKEDKNGNKVKDGHKKDTEKAEKLKQEQLRKEEELRSNMRNEAEERKKNEEQEEKKRKEEEKLRKEEELRRQEEKRQQEKKKREDEEKLRKEEELRRQEEKRQQEERKRREEEKLKEEEELRRQEERRQQEEAKLRKEEELRKQEEDKLMREEGMKKKEEDKLMEEKEHQKLRELRRLEEEEPKEQDDNIKNQNHRVEQQHETQDDELLAETCNMTPRDRAIELLRKGGMPLFPAGRREWDEEEVVTLITLPTTIKWPPKTWKGMTPEQKYFNWEFASMALELSKGMPLQMTKEELMVKYNFLALPGSKMPSMEEGKTTEVKSRFYLYSVLKETVNKTKINDNNISQLLTMLEAATTKRDISLDKLCGEIDSVGVNLRLGDEL